MISTSLDKRAVASAAALILLLAPAALSGGAAAAAPGPPVEVGRQVQIEAGGGAGLEKIEALTESGAGSPKPIDPEVVKNPLPKPPTGTDDEAAPDTTAPPTTPPPTTPSAEEAPDVDAGSPVRPVPERRAAPLEATVELTSNGAPSATILTAEPTGSAAAGALPPGADIALVTAGVLLVAAGIGALVWMALRRPDVEVVP